MRFRIGNGLVIGNGTRYLLSSVSGFESPELRLGDGVYAGRDGGFVSGHFYGQRTLTFEGFYIGNDCVEADNLRLTLFRYLRIRYLAPIFILTNTGKYYYTEGYVSEVKSKIDTSRSGQFQITFRCPDPFIYDGGDGVSEASTWESDNLVFNNTTEILNAGGVDTSPIITLTGVFTNPTITNETTLKTMELELTTTRSTDVVEINMQKRIITLNGSAVNIDRSVDSSWWTLQMGLNDIRLSVDSRSGSSTAVIKHRKGYSGI